MEIRHARPEDVQALARVEALCFPQAEAASQAVFAERVETYGNHFLLLWDGGELVSFVDGLCTDEPDLLDAMYAHADYHRETGQWQMVFGVNTIPERRGQGLASYLMRAFIREAREQGRGGLVLTCKERLIGWYASFGFRDEGLSGSCHGNAVWHQMRLTWAGPSPVPPRA